MRYAHPTIVCTNVINAAACVIVSYLLMTLSDSPVAPVTSMVLTGTAVFDLYVAVLVYKAMQ